MTNRERAARYLGTVWATVSPEQIDGFTAEFDAVEREAKVAVSHQRGLADRMRRALEKIASGVHCAYTCTAYLTAMAALGCPHTPPCPGCTGVVAQDPKPLRPRED